MKTMNIGVKTAVAAAIAATLSTSAYSQAFLEEVFVTAQKRAQSANDVGIAISAFGANQIEDFRIQTAADLVAITPNLDYKTTNGGLNPAITIRGVGMNDFNVNSSAAVGVYVDDVYLTSTAMLTNVNFDLERVEVLKGPQGTLYGRNSNGGAVNFLSKRPTFEPEGYIKAGAGNYDSTEVEGAFGNGISDEIAFRVSARYSDREGYQETNSYGGDAINGLPAVKGGQTLGDLESETIRGQLMYQTDGFDINLSITSSSDEGGTTAQESLGAFDASAGFAPCSDAAILNASCQDFSGFTPSADKDPYKVNLGQGSIDAISDLDNEYLLSNVSLNVNIGEMTLSSVTSYLTMDRTWGEGVIDHDPSLDNFITIFKDEEVSQFTQELRLAGDSDKTDWVVGVYYSKDEIETDNVIDVSGFIGSAAVLGIPGGLPIGSVPVPWSYEQDTTVMALFGHYEYFMTDELKLVVGLRYSDEERDFDGMTDGSAIGEGSPVADVSISDSKASGKLGLEYQPNDEWLWFGSVSTGFKSGGVSGDFAFSDVNYVPYDTEEITSYEVGFKATLGEGTIQANMAAFYYDYTDMQTVISLPNATQPLTNAEEATIAGVEGDIMWRISERLDVTFNFGYLDHELDDDNLGDKMPNTADLSYGGIIRYETPVSDAWNIVLQTNAKWTDEMYRDAQNAEVLKADDTLEVGANISMLNESEGWDISLWGKNLTDEETITFGFDSTGFSGNWGQAYNSPMTYGLTVKKAFF